MKDLFNENHKTLLKEFKEDTNKWKDIPCSWIGKINIVKMATVLKAIYTFSVTPTKIPKPFFAKIEETILKCVWNHKRPQIAKAILRKKEQSQRYHSSRFQIILQSHSNETVPCTGTKTDTLTSETK